MEFLGIEIGNWSEIISAIATFVATGTALILSVKKPKEIIFALEKGHLRKCSSFSIDNSKPKKWDFKNLWKYLTEKTVYVDDLNVKAFNTGFTNLGIFELGIIGKGDFRKQKLGDGSLFTTLPPHEAQKVNFGGGTLDGDKVKLKSWKLNPFLSDRKVSFRVYLKDPAGKLYKSQVFKIKNDK